MIINKQFIYSLCKTLDKGKIWCYNKATVREIPKQKKGMNHMSNEKMYYEAQEVLLSEIAKEKSLFSFRTIIKLLTANAIARNL